MRSRYAMTYNAQGVGVVHGAGVQGRAGIVACPTTRTGKDDWV
jgi:hypothetical protein